MLMPRLCEHTGQLLPVRFSQVHPYGSKALPPPDLAENVGASVHERPYSLGSNHDVEMVTVPQGGEDLALDPERGTAMVVLFDRTREVERSPARIRLADHGRVALG